jgi:hypothetical protein
MATQTVVSSSSDPEPDVQDLASALLSAFRFLHVTRLLPSNTGRGTLRDDVKKLTATVNSNFDIDRITPLLRAALADDRDDAFICDRLYDAVTESTPPPRPVASILQQTPWLRNTGSFSNSSEYRRYVDDVLREELGHMLVDIPDFHQMCFGGVPNLEMASKTFLEDCLQGSPPMFDGGWRGWPEEAKQVMC